MTDHLVWLMDRIKSEGLVLVNSDLIILKVNKAGEKITNRIGGEQKLINLFTESLQEGPIKRDFAVMTGEGIMYTISIEVESEPVPGTNDDLRLFYLRYCSDQQLLEERLARYEYAMTSIPSGIALYSINTETRESRILVQSKKYLEFMKLTSAELEEEGLQALGRRIAPEDRERLDPQMNEYIMTNQPFTCDFRIVHNQDVYWRYCNGIFEKSQGRLNHVLLTTVIEDFTAGKAERDLADRAVATNANLACLMEQLFDVQFHVDETLRILQGGHSSKLRTFFFDNIPWSLHDVLADNDSSNRLVKYLATRPILRRGTIEEIGDPPSLVTVNIVIRSEVRQVQIFAATAYMEDPDVVQTTRQSEPIIQTLFGPTVSEHNPENRIKRRRFLVAIRFPTRERVPKATLVPAAAPAQDMERDLAMIIGRALRGLIMDSLTAINNHTILGVVEFISPGFSPRNVSWCLEELVLLLPSEVQSAIVRATQNGGLTEAVKLIAPFLGGPSNGISRTVLGLHLLMGLAANEKTDTDRLVAMQLIHGLIRGLSSKSPLSSVIQLEFATMLAREAACYPSMYSKEPVRSWVRKSVVLALQSEHSEQASVKPAAFFLTIIFADFCLKSNRDNDARELLMSALTDMRTFVDKTCPELYSVRQIMAIATHNLAVDAYKRGDKVVALSHIIRLQQISPLPPQSVGFIEYVSARSG
jgi:PAS domain-containing protein